MLLIWFCSATSGDHWQWMWYIILMCASDIKLFQVLLFYFILVITIIWNIDEKPHFRLSFSLVLDPLHRKVNMLTQIALYWSLNNWLTTSLIRNSWKKSKMSDILIMHNKYSSKTQIECKWASCHFFNGRVVLLGTVQVQIGGGGAQGGNSSGGEVWTFTSGCCPVWEAANVKKAWLWIPHWDGLGPEGMPANLQPALLPENSCSLHLPAPHGGYLREVRPTSPYQERSSFVKRRRNFRFWRNLCESFPFTF